MLPASGAVDVQTIADLRVVDGEICPTAGTITLLPPGSLVKYLADGSVTIDLDADGTPELTFPSCLDPRLFVCAVASP